MCPSELCSHRPLPCIYRLRAPALWRASIHRLWIMSSRKVCGACLRTSPCTACTCRQVCACHVNGIRLRVSCEWDTVARVHLCPTVHKRREVIRVLNLLAIYCQYSPSRLSVFPIFPQCTLPAYTPSILGASIGVVRMDIVLSCWCINSP